MAFVSSNNSTKMPSKDKLCGFLNKVEQRQIGGPSKKKFWFVLDNSTPYLYWFKNEGDVSSVGRISLSGAAFTFDPRVSSSFEIHVLGDVHVFEAEDKKERIRWLQHLQANRRKHYERENVDDILNVETNSSNPQEELRNCQSVESDTSIGVDALVDLDVLESFSSGTSSTVSPASVFPSDTRFYLNPDGELAASSLDVPSPTSPGKVIMKSADEFLNKIAEGTKRKASDPVKAFSRARRSIKLPMFNSNSKNQCEQCKEVLKYSADLKERNFELADELTANAELINALRIGIVSAHNQRDALSLMQTESEQKKLDYVIERESLLTKLQLHNTELKSELSSSREAQEKLRAENQSLKASMEAFKESVKTKDELIMKMCENQEVLEKMNKMNRRVSVTQPMDIGIPEGILVHGGTPTENATQAAFEETNVDDIDELKDLVIGYESQNCFLNNEVLELQKIVASLEEREKKLIRQNFQIEACFYQLKSKYMMVLNHFRSGIEDAKKALKPELIEELIDDVNKPPEFQHRKDPVNQRDKTMAVIVDTSPEGAVTDSLGFYLQPRKPLSGASTPSDECPLKKGEEMMDKAAELKNMSDQITKKINLEKSEKYMEWIQKWDGFLVNHFVNQPLNNNQELKNLVRQGVPSTYRTRVWKALVQALVFPIQAETGFGYYNCLIQRANNANSETDDLLHQVDLDLLRTLPTNVNFNDMNNEKICQLKRVLYAYRFHNKTVGYCQGLNRLAAVALLYLKEEDAFWFLVAVVEYLQPPDYYTTTVGAVVDQKVLLDIIQEKIPKLFNHLKNLDVDLSLFTLPWFILVFVDTLHHELFLNVFDAFLLEGNKVIFRFAIAILKSIESNILSCTSMGAVHKCLNDLSNLKIEPKDLAKIAFNNLMSLPLKHIEARRQYHSNQLKPRSA